MYKLIPFSQIKENSTELILEIAEGNIGLEYLLNSCVEYDIDTYSSCGDVHPYISFIINDKNQDILYNLCLLILENFNISDCTSVKIEAVDGNNLCTIKYYDGSFINPEQFFIIVDVYLRKCKTAIINKDISIFQDVNEMVKKIYSYGFNNCMEIFKSIYDDDGTFEYHLTIHGTNYKKIQDFQKKAFTYAFEEYRNIGNDYSICYYIEDLKQFQKGSKTLVRKK